MYEYINIYIFVKTNVSTIEILQSDCCLSGKFMLAQKWLGNAHRIILSYWEIFEYIGGVYRK